MLKDNKMNHYTRLQIEGYEDVVRCDNSDVGFTAWISIHNSNRGPALGGCRVWNYDNKDEALIDVLRLSRGMTYKNALARLPIGGGKSVVHTDITTVNRAAMFAAIGDFVETFDGRYIIAEDVNSTLEDMEIVKEKTNHVATVGASGNPSPFTAYGVYCAIKACVKFKLQRDTLDGLTVAVQGVGETGGRLAELLYKDHCNIIATDINQENLQRLAGRVDFQQVPPAEIYTTGCDIFSPCALGGILNEQTIPALLCQIVAGSANNQLLTDKDGERLHRRGILYAPDYAVNAGGVINISCELGTQYNREKAKKRTSRIESTLLEIFRTAKQRSRPPHVIADCLAEDLFSLRAAA